METEKEKESSTIEDKIVDLFHTEPTDILSMRSELLERKQEMDYKLTKIVRAFEAEHGYGVEIEVVKDESFRLSTRLVCTKLIFW